MTRNVYTVCAVYDWGIIRNYLFSLHVPANRKPWEDIVSYGAHFVYGDYGQIEEVVFETEADQINFVLKFS